MKKIQLTRGFVALVDDEDFEELNKYKWNASAMGYAVRHIPWPNGKRLKNGKQAQRALKMHRVIMNTPTGMLTDHIDHNPFNNQKSNLRVCTSSQNSQNKTKPVSGITSKYKGVRQRTYRGKYKYYVATIKLNNKATAKHFPFTLHGELQAAQWYNGMAKKHFGEFAHLNKI